MSDYGFLALPQDVAAFAWSAPMRELAKSIGISDVALRKLLVAQGIAPPPQGHWNRVHAGRAVPSVPPRPPRGPGQRGRIQLDKRFRGHVPEAGRMPVGGPFASALVPEDLAELKAQELKAIGRVAPPRDLDRAAGLTAIHAREVKRRAKFASSGWRWDAPLFTGKLAQRQLRLAAGLIAALRQRGHDGEVGENEGSLEIVCEVGDMHPKVQFTHTDKRNSPVRHASPDAELPAATPLRMALTPYWHDWRITEWSDAKAGRLEAQLAEIAADVIVAAEAGFRQGLVAAGEHEAQMTQWAEERRSQALAAMAQQRLADLRASGELLRQAEEIRAVVATVKAAVERGGVELTGGASLAGWERWALSQADALDPVLSGQVLTHLYVPQLDGDE